MVIDNSFFLHNFGTLGVPKFIFFGREGAEGTNFLKDWRTSEAFEGDDFGEDFFEVDVSIVLVLALLFGGK